MGVLGESIKRKLQESFNPTHLEVIDESAKHSHHQGAIKHGLDGGGKESHFHVVIKSNSFEGLNRLQIHRLVMELLNEEILQIHAFSLEIGRV